MSDKLELSKCIFKRIDQLMDGKSQRVFSELIGRSPFYLSSMRRAGSIPSLPVIKDICDLKDITLSEFFAFDIVNPKNSASLNIAASDKVVDSDITTHEGEHTSQSYTSNHSTHSAILRAPSHLRHQ